ncbi:DNA translocase FtsK [bacterium LRH843]|nr:DNA translocase FtsK [bacterium LRH843]
MEKIQRFMKRIKQLLGGNEQADEEDQLERSESTSAPAPYEERESRVLYHYPKQGSYRFPLQVDPPSKRAVRVREEEHVAEQLAEQEGMNLNSSSWDAAPPTKEKEKKVEDKTNVQSEKRFMNRDFKVTSVPSPIYGFQGRRTTEDKSDIVEDEEMSYQTIELNNEEERLLDSAISESNYEKEEPEHTSKPVHKEEALDDIVEAIQLKEKQDDTEEESTFLLEEDIFGDELIVEETIQHNDETILSEKSDDHTGLINKEYTHETAAAMELTTTELNMPENVRDQDTEQVKRIDKENKSKEILLPKKDQTNMESKVPYNVIMLPQDRTKTKPQKPRFEKSSTYQLPGIQLLHFPEIQQEDDTEWLEEQGAILEEALQSFHVDANVVHVTKGPSVTRFEIQPARGVKVNKVTSLTDDIKLALAAKDIRMEAPIPGKNTIGIEVPNRTSTPVFLREIIRRDVFIRSESPLTVALGLDISGQPIVTDLKKMPHGLVAGATGSGKSVCINSVLVSLLYKSTPDEVKLMLIDPKMVELAPYNGVPHLITPVITDSKQATTALKWVVQEMERRYELFSQKGVRDIGRFNKLYSEEASKPALPYMLVVIDELADLMMVSPQEVEDSICRIAQKARACGIHLLLATQRPSVDVITGLIKANIPTRIAFSVSSQTDSRTILDMGGAERLLGRGDMLFHENGMPKPVRVQGTFVSDEEIEDVVAYVKKQRGPEYLIEPEQLKRVVEQSEADDEYFEEACYFVIEHGSASASSLQRRFRIGYNRAARLIDMMEERGFISEAMGSKPRHVLVDDFELEERLSQKDAT